MAAEIEGKQVVRSYTPTTLDDDKGHFDLVVKVCGVSAVPNARSLQYGPKLIVQTYEKGNISRYLSLLSPGQEVRIKGPKGKFVYS